MAKQTVEEIISTKFDQFVSDRNLMKVLEFYINKRVNGLISHDELKNIISSCVNTTIEKSNSSIDVSELLVCTYNDDKVGFFYRDYITDANSLMNPIIYDIFKSFESNYIAIRKNTFHLDKPGTYDYVDDEINSLREINGKQYIVNCKIGDSLGSYEEINRMMREDNHIIKPYKVGLASREEMSQVYDYVINNLLKETNKKKH